MRCRCVGGGEAARGRIAGSYGSRRSDHHVDVEAVGTVLSNEGEKSRNSSARCPAVSELMTVPDATSGARPLPIGIGTDPCSGRARRAGHRGPARRTGPPLPDRHPSESNRNSRPPAVRVGRRGELVVAIEDSWVRRSAPLRAAAGPVTRPQVMAACSELPRDRPRSPAGDRAAARPACRWGRAATAPYHAPA